MQAAYEKAWAGRESRCTVTAPDESLVFLASLRPRSEAGTVCEVVASCIDITELKKRTNELILARDRAEAADQAKTDFLAVISHEIRTPLNSILGYAGLLKDDLVDETHRAWLQSIEECGEALCGIIGDILDFSHMEAGRLQLNPRPVRLQPLVQTIVTMFSPRAAARGIELACDVAPGVPAAVATDGTRLRQVLVNLISNAIKFTPAGRVEVFVRPGRGDPAPGGSLRVVQFAVRDNGVGIPPEKREVLFKPFSQADASPTRQFGGIGLGLVICQRLVHSLGGEIWFTSEPNVGSEFTFEICAPEVSVQPEAGAPEPPEPRPLDFGSALPILVADADPAGRATMEELLELLGCAADFAIDGTEAVRRTASHNYAAVFLDLGLPAPGGLEVARRIRIARQGRSQPRIVGVSSGAVVQQLPRCLDAGMDAVLTKPVAPGAVRNELLRVVSRGFH
jgi:signal transduction histidine kinase/CheY-like chemotaxis protein